MGEWKSYKLGDVCSRLKSGKGINTLKEIKRVLPLFVLLALCVCNGRNSSADDGVLHITEDNVVNLDQPFTETMLQSWEAVFLDDSDYALLGDVSRLRYDDGLFFIESDAGHGDISIVVFDSLGHYRNRISHIGNAIYEYNDIEGWTIDRDRNELLIFGFNSDCCIKYYNYQGEHLRKRTINEPVYGYLTASALVLTDPS